MSKNDLAMIVGQRKFGFHKIAEGKVVVKEGDACNSLHFLLDGELYVTTEADDHGYILTEEIFAPNIIQPEHIFGLSQRYSRTFSTKTKCSILSIAKSEVVKLSEEHEIFRINFLNILSTQSQKQQRNPWRIQPKELDKRIARFIESHCLRPVGRKSLKIKMERLAHEMNDSRLDVSRALNKMERENLVILHRGLIEIPSFELLIM
jgi:CRP-like cAMP-binding protein